MRRQTNRKVKRAGYTVAHVHHLVVGRDFYGDGFGTPSSRLPVGPERDADLAAQQVEIEHAMRAAWPILRDAAFAEIDRDRRRHGPVKFPFGWWLCESPERRDPGMTEFDQLSRLGLLSDEDRMSYRAWRYPSPVAEPHESLMTAALADEADEGEGGVN